MENRPRKLLLLDSYALAFRMFYAYAKNPLINKNGLDVSLVHGYWGTVLRLLAKHKPTHFAIVRDVNAPTFRHELYPEYKANRGPMPEEMARQLPLLEEAIQASGIPVLSEKGFEADDVMAAAAEVAYKEGIEQIFLVTKDKDLSQVVNDRIHLFHLEKGADGIDFGPEQVQEKFGVPPEQIRDYLALMGDSSDNVPGVAKVGPKTAVQLLLEFGNIDNLYENLDKVSKKGLHDNLEKGKENAFLSRELVTIQSSRGFKGTLEELEFHGIESDALAAVFKENEIFSLLRLLEDVPSKAGFSSELPKRSAKPFETVMVRTTKAFQEMQAAVESCESPSIAVMFDGENQMETAIVGVAFAVEPNRGFYVPLGHTDDMGIPLNNIDTEYFADWFVPVFTIASKKWRMFSAKTTLHVLSRAMDERVEPAEILDAQIGAWMLSPGESKYELEELSMRFVGRELDSKESLVGHGKNEIPFSRVSVDEGGEFAAKNAAAIYELWNYVQSKLTQANLEKHFNETEMPILKVLFNMEENGAAVHLKSLEELSKDFSARIEKTENFVYQLAGKPFNIGSPKQLSEVLYDDLKLKVLKKTATGRSTDSAVLDRLLNEFDLSEQETVLLQSILHFRELKKLQNTYVEVLPTLVNKETHRIHTNFVQWGTATGRLSSRDPNLQNIPIRSEEGKKIRAAFVPADPENQVILSADYSQIELRMLAHLSEDEKLIEAYNSGTDIHALTAAAVFGKSPEEVSADERRRAKVVNFGVLYGMTPFRLSRDLHISMGEAKSFIDGYFHLYQGVEAYIEKIKNFAHEHGYVETLSGRRRAILGIDSSDRTECQMAERMAVNTPVQGSAADLIKTAMIRIASRIERDALPLTLMLQVHDELVFECPKNQADELGKIVQSEMQQAMTLKVPLVASVGFGANWLEAH
ncbi:DNA polymerase I [Fibrobacter intestinalis]|uniref:DNA polymerase I n=1 Tax=Fibrobacter intestinalis TaxID=28122 RepID=A0A1T4M096_9BACT|nr:MULTISPECIES: DNA polymerase I [Fibrobacter]PBC74810.1 DNA polymerase I [Fibrobacter sp. NR9]SJZ60188.1 DNA polymerase I [Fibrobacter intestinalis]